MKLAVNTIVYKETFKLCARADICHCKKYKNKFYNEEFDPGSG